MDALRGWSGNLPTFHSFWDLNESSWRDYMHLVYGRDSFTPETHFPINLQTFTFFYSQHLPARDRRLVCARPIMENPFPLSRPASIPDRQQQLDQA